MVTASMRDTGLFQQHRYRAQAVGPFHRPSAQSPGAANVIQRRLPRLVAQAEVCACLEE